MAPFTNASFNALGKFKAYLLMHTLLTLSFAFLTAGRRLLLHPYLLQHTVQCGCFTSLTKVPFAAGSSAYPGAVLQGRRLAHTTSLPAHSTQPFAAASGDNNHALHRFPSFPASSAQFGSLSSFPSQSAAPQPALLQSLYTTSAVPNACNMSAGLTSLPESFSCASGLSCATAKPQLSGDCQSTNNSEDSILHSINSSPCYQSSYSGSYLSNPFQRPPSPVSRALDNAALLEQTAAMMKNAAAALQNLQSSSPLYRPQQQQLPTDRCTSASMPQFSQPCFAPLYSNAMQSASFPPIQTAPSMPCIGMQALEELMMSDSSVDSSPVPALASSLSAPACLLTMPQPASPCSAPAKSPTRRESKTATPQPAKGAVRAVADIPVFDCKAAAAAAAAAAQHAQQAAQAEADFAQQTQHAAADLADFDLPLIDDCFLDSVGSGMGTDLDTDLTSGLCFDGCYFEQTPFDLGFDRSDSSDNLAEQVSAVTFASLHNHTQFLLLSACSCFPLTICALSCWHVCSMAW